ncbi:MAG: hypothetical protein HYY30_01675 [Chloroflexi bacterium]|nr:hypothetical protein [Chloroflexota bacterium]
MEPISVLLYDRTFASRVERLREALGEGFVVVAPKDFRMEMIVPLAAEIDVIVTSNLPDGLVECAPRLKLVQAWIAGVDKFNLDILRRRDIVLCSCHGNSSAVAEHALGLLLACGRHIVRGDRHLREGHWAVGFAGRVPPHSSVRGKTVGLIGFGAIAQDFVRLARGLEFRFLAVKKRPDEALRGMLGVAFLGAVGDMPHVLANSDFVLVALPKTVETTGLIGEQEFKQMKPGAFLIQVGRAETVDEKSLYLACKEGWIAGAAIDPWYRYPPPEPCHPAHYPFHDLDNVIMTPHSASWTNEAFEEQMQFVAANLRRFRERQPLERQVDYDLAY